METVYNILKNLGEADLDTLVKAAAERGVPPVVASRLLMRLVERGKVEVVCGPAVRYRCRCTS